MELPTRPVRADDKENAYTPMALVMPLVWGALAFQKMLWEARAIMLGAALLIAPRVVYGDSLDSTRNIMRFLEGVQNVLNVLLPILVTLAAIVFFWGMVKFIWSGPDAKTKEDGKQLMIWGVIALFVMISIWGLVELIGSLFGVDNDAQITVPSVPSSEGGLGGGGSL